MAALVKKGPEERSFFIRRGNILQRVEIGNICWINSEGNYITINMKSQKKYVVKMSLRKILQQLPDGEFIQIHRSVAVKVPFIKKIDVSSNEVFTCGVSLPLGSRYKPELLDRLNLLQ